MLLRLSPESSWVGDFGESAVFFCPQVSACIIITGMAFEGSELCRIPSCMATFAVNMMLCALVKAAMGVDRGASMLVVLVKTFVGYSHLCWLCIQSPCQ